MSSILKALEKAEQSSSTRRGGPERIVASRQQRPSWVLPAGVIGGAAVAAMLTYAAMGGFSKHNEKVAAQAVTPPVQAVPAEPAPAPAATKAATAVAPVAAPAAPASVPAAAAPVAAKAAPAPAAKNAPPVKAVAKPAKQPVAKASAAAQPARTVTAAKAIRPGRDASRPAAAVQPAAVPLQLASPSPAPAAAEPARPELRVTGIAWQNNSESSVAIVNGRMLQQGGSVDGYRIEKIFEDRVRLSSKGGTVEVPLTGGE
ncbi:hypothetical protein L4X63_07295 [Geomonas sp. Red32]|uniref:hypothetical protein n=1 Tax=Geomonas sp. Red32 TaxID=2912856 RepID=UPI00202CCAF3|nr:hypothetical protein [Geomonas sp. Red32]MCM0081391.1 hypothetical protein [Geomonas sp. Red32]